jgi:hypothetical protein
VGPVRWAQLAASETTNTLNGVRWSENQGHNVVLLQNLKRRRPEVDWDGDLGPGRRGWKIGRRIITQLIAIYHWSSYASFSFHCIVCMYIPLAGGQPRHFPYARNTYVEAEGIRPFFLRMSSGVVRGRRGFMVTAAGFGNKRAHDWQPHHTSSSSLPSLGGCFAPRPRIMSLGVLKAAHTLIRSSTHTGLLTLADTGKPETACP